MTTVVRRCPICGSEVAIYLGEFGGIEWFRCRNCGIDWHEDLNEPGA